MRWHPVKTPKDPDFELLFQLYQSSFPIYEQRTREKQEQILSHPAYTCWALEEWDSFGGLMGLWEGEGFYYVEHFAVRPDLRGQRLGGRALEQLIARGKPVVLEIDPPEDQVSRRRQGFYERCGFCANPWPHVHPPYRAGYQGHPLVVMTCPEPWSRTQYETFAAFLRHTVMADCGCPDK